MKSVRSILAAVAHVDGRWQFFLDICTANSYIMYSSFPGNNEGRFYFVKKLASQLVEAHMRNRLEIPHIPREIKSSIRRILRIPERVSNARRTFGNKKILLYMPFKT
jgi:hypothetical protein